MKPLSDNQKLLFSNILTIIAIFVAVFASNKLSQPPAAQPTFGAASVSACYFENGKFIAGDGCAIQLKSGSTFSQDSGSSMLLSGAVTATAINVQGSYVGITPVATTTPIAAGYSFTGNVDGVPTLSAGGLRADTGVYTTSVTIAGTPVVAFSTPVSNLKCAAGTQNVAAGAATVIPATLTAAGITTPVAVQRSLAADPNADHSFTTHTNSAGVVTLKVWQNIIAGTTTPQAATTTVAVDYTVCGQ